MDLTAMRLESAPFRLRYFIQVNLEEWVRNTVVDSIKAFATAAGMSSRYMDAISIERTGEFSVDVILDLQTAEGAPLGIFLETGTKPHPIVARWSPMLSFYWQKLGRWVKFKSVKHPGTKGKHIMEYGAKHGIPRLQEMIVQKTNEFLQESRMT